MNQLKLIEMQEGKEHLSGNKKYLVNMFQKETTKFLMEIHKNEHAKAKANLNEMKDGLTHAIALLNGFNQTRLWLDDVTLNFFEVKISNSLLNLAIRLVFSTFRSKDSGLMSSNKVL